MVVPAMPLVLYRYLPPLSQYCVFSEKGKSTNTEVFHSGKSFDLKKSKKGTAS